MIKIYLPKLNIQTITNRIREKIASYQSPKEHSQQIESYTDLKQLKPKTEKILSEIEIKIPEMLATMSLFDMMK